MDISIFNEQYPDERRVGLTPAAVQRLVESGHHVYVEKDAGLRSGFLDDQYIKAGGVIVYARDEAFGRADLALGVSPLNESDLQFIRPDQIIMSFTLQAATRERLVNELCGKGTTVIGFEAIETDDGRLPIMEPMSEIAGTMGRTVAGVEFRRPGNLVGRPAGDSAGECCRPRRGYCRIQRGTQCPPSGSTGDGHRCQCRPAAVYQADTRQQHHHQHPL